MFWIIKKIVLFSLKDRGIWGIIFVFKQIKKNNDVIMYGV